MVGFNEGIVENLMNFWVHMQHVRRKEHAPSKTHEPTQKILAWKNKKAYKNAISIQS